MTALVIGAILAIAALAFVVYPLLRPVPRAETRPEASVPPLSPERERALAALQEIEFEHDTGKLSDADYERLRAEHAWAATPEPGPAASALALPDDAVEEFIRAYRARQPLCPVCGPRPEPDARHCSSCGRALGSVCPRCGAPAAEPGARFCERCGAELSR